MEFIFDEVTIDRDNNKIHCISDRNNIAIDCELKNKKLRWVMEHIDTSTLIIDTAAQKPLVYNNFMNNTFSEANMPDVHVISADNPDDMIANLLEFLKDWLGKNYNKEGE